MKKLQAIILALTILVFTPVIGYAKTTISGGPYTNLSLTGQIVNLKLTGYPAGSGFYIIQCKRINGDSRPQVCNSNSQLWISTSVGADYLPTADIQFKPTATFTYGAQTVDCVKTPCGIFIRLDHKASPDRSEDQFIPISFVGSALPTSNADVIKAYVNGKLIQPNQAVSLKNQTVFRIDATAISGAVLTYSTLSNTCSLSGNQVTILRGTGFCEIDIYSPGNTQYASITNHYLFKLMPGIQTISVPTKVKPGTSLTLPANTNFGVKVTYEVSNTTNCSIASTPTNYVLTFNKVGACNVRATAPGAPDTYSDLKQTISFKIR